jgi:hypothetical protein
MRRANMEALMRNANLDFGTVKDYLEKEHEAYYGKPHGHTVVDDDGTTAGFYEGPKWFGWIRSSRTEVAFKPETHTIWVSGRRHSISEFMANLRINAKIDFDAGDFEVISIASQDPDRHPLDLM